MERQRTIPEPLVNIEPVDGDPMDPPLSAADMIAEARALVGDLKTTLPTGGQSAFTYSISSGSQVDTNHGSPELRETKIREFAESAPREDIVETLLQFHRLSKLLVKPLIRSTGKGKEHNEDSSDEPFKPAFAATVAPRKTSLNHSTTSSHRDRSSPSLLEKDVSDNAWTRETTNLVSIASAQIPAPETTTNLTKSVDNLGFKTINQYMVVEMLGHGAEGKVKLVVDQECGEHRAMKIIRRPKCFVAGQGRQAAAAARSLARLKQQIAILKKLRHQSILRVYEVIDDPDAEKLYLVLQFAQHGALVTMTDMGCEPLPSDVFTPMARQVCSGLAYLHSHGVVHRDIKPENLLRGSNDQVFLGDFGVAEVFEYDENRVDFEWKRTRGTARRRLKIKGMSGTPAFLPPEVIASSLVTDNGGETSKTLSPSPPRKGSASQDETNGDGSGDADAGEADHGEGEGIDGFAADVWALGMTFYVILVGKFPFEVSKDQHELSLAAVRAALTEGFSIPSDLDLPGEWISLLKDMLNPDPAKRIDIHAVRKRVKAMCRTLEAKTIPILDVNLLEGDADDPFTPAKRDTSPEVGAAHPGGAVMTSSMSVPTHSFGMGSAQPSSSSPTGSRRTSLLAAPELQSKSPVTREEEENAIVSAEPSPGHPVVGTHTARRSSASVPLPPVLSRQRSPLLVVEIGVQTESS